MLCRSKQSHIPFIILLLTTLSLLFTHIIPLFEQPPYFHWDHVGQINAGNFNFDFLWPDFSGWNPYFFFGFSQGVFYPPLFHWLNATLANFWSLNSCYLALLSVSVLTLPFLFYLVLKKCSLSRNASLTGMLLCLILLATNQDPSGLNFYSTFFVGNSSHALSLPLFLLFLSSLQSENRKVLRLITPILLCLIILTHLMTAIFAFSLLLAYIIVDSGSHKKSADLKLAGCTALLLSAFWLLPFVLLPKATFMPLGDLTSKNLLSISLFFILLFLWIPNKYRFVKTRGLALCFVVSIILLIINSNTNHLLPLRYHRATIILFLLAILSLSELFERVLFSLPKYQIGTNLLLLIFFVLSSVLTQKNPQHFASPQSPDTSTHTRGIVLSTQTSLQNFHYLNHYLPRQYTAEMMHGLFIESTPMIQSILAIENLFSRFDKSLIFPSWGGYRNKESTLSKPIDHTIFKKYINHLGVDFFLSFANDHSLFLPNENSELLDKNVKITHLKKSDLVSAIDLDETSAVDNDSFQFAVLSSFQEGSLFPLPTTLQSSKRIEALENNPITDVEISPKKQRIKFKIETNQNIPVVIKYTWLPQWKAYSNGHRIPIYKIAPDFMLLFTSGDVVLKYSRTKIELFSILLSVLGITWLILQAKRL